MNMENLESKPQERSGSEFSIILRLKSDVRPPKHRTYKLLVLTVLLVLPQSTRAQPARPQPSSPRPSLPHIEYHFTQHIKTQGDHRIRTTTISLTADAGYTGYQYHEQIMGATTPQVRSVTISNLYQRKATAQERASLVQALLRARAFELTSDPKAVQTGAYFGSLNIRINGRRSQVFFNHPPRSPAKKAVHKIMLNFARQLGIDKRPANAITITEGDRQPARKVSLAEVIAHPDRYHGKRISVVGFYHGEEEGSSLSVDEAASRARAYKRSVWRSGTSTFADKAALQNKNDAWLRVEGVFLRGPGGHMGLWPGEIVRLTRIKPELPPRLPLGLSSGPHSPNIPKAAAS